MPLAPPGGASRVAIMLPPVLSSLCLVHCVGATLLAPLAPALAATIESPLVEGFGLLIAVALVPWALRAWTGAARAGAAVLAGVAVGGALLAHVVEHELAVQAALLLLAGVQAASATRRLREHARCC